MNPDLVGLVKKRYGVEVDIWNLGVIVFELLTGKPYKGPSDLEANSDVISDVIFNIFRKLIIEDSTKTEPTERVSINELENRLVQRDTNSTFYAEMLIYNKILEKAKRQKIMMIPDLIKFFNETR